ncbi:adenylate/guanylate cyclase domain-containing protein [Treponema pedis]|uniref:Adenylate/guanylate cyclase domain-containing protein n=2 Tax=Treponema pedis TaxID=409322 RepID=A0A7S6WNX9_9SPIR|nr:adenylate/guanylate cyclase domain-containing protein [Treponema pedis]QOW60633.1 adenylate/guanylate cyclase domain-containing protein [Treponema pedis]
MTKPVFEQIKKNWKRITLFPHTSKIILLVILATLMLLPFSMDKMDLFIPENSSVLLYPLTVLFSGTLQGEINFFYITCFSFFLLPVAFIVIFISIFQKKISGKIIYIISFVCATFYLAASVSGMVSFANTPRWFYALDLRVYSAFFINLIFHIFLIARGIIFIKAKNELHSEYKSILLEEEKKERDLLKRAIARFKTEKNKNKEKGKNKDTEKALKIDILLKKYTKKFKNVKRKSHIKTKIIIVIIFTITVILSTFIYTDLINYKALLTQTVNNTGKNLAEQVAAIYDFSDGLHAKISAFLEGIKKTNLSSPFPWHRVDIITTNSKTHFFLENIDSFTELPDFNVFSYTTAAGRVREIPAEEKRITAEDAAFYIEHFRNEQTKSEPIRNAEKGTYLYVYPVTFSRKDGQRLVGFSVVTYLQEILDRPYFQAKVFVCSLSAVFFYASIIITLFLADFIADPVIFLCGSVRKTANILSEMLSGSAKIEADRLIFNEKVATHDEVKNLSVEIKNIVSLVRGILPYVSFHTLQNAEKHLNRQSTTRDLCFLFTDIRGFTNLCETLPPKEVIPILNRYLDIETKIIFDNGGDVDKYVGDAMMAFFSGPKKEINACKAAMEIRKAIRKEQQASLTEGSPLISIGIGINSGPVVFGSIGSKTRKDFTSIGDTVNLASRLEGANKEYGSKSIISEAVYENLNDTFICRELDYVTVKGKTEPVRIFEILQSAELTTEKLHDLKRLFETGLSYYRKKHWKTAEKYFLTCKEKYNDTPSKVFLKRIAHYQVSPPKAGWKGVFVMSGK